MFHILFVIKTRIHHSSTNVHIFINLSQHLYVSICDNHGLLMMYDIHLMHMQLESFKTTTNNTLEYLVITFNANKQKVIHTTCVYRTHSCLVSTFVSNLQALIQNLPSCCPIIILRDFNIDNLEEITMKKIKKFMDTSIIVKWKHHKN